MPTDGNYTKFLSTKLFSSKEHEDTGDLHIGITNSNSETFDFDMNGVNRNSIRWSHIPSIVIRLETKKNDQIFRAQSWDVALEAHSGDEKKWSKSNYDEFTFNCLDFVISFLLNLGYFDDNVTHTEPSSLLNGYLREKLSRDLIEPEFVKCLKYLRLLVRLNESEVFEEKLNESNV